MLDFLTTARNEVVIFVGVASGGCWPRTYGRLCCRGLCGSSKRSAYNATTRCIVVVERERDSAAQCGGGAARQGIDLAAVGMCVWLTRYLRQLPGERRPGTWRAPLRRRAPTPSRRGPDTPAPHFSTPRGRSNIITKNK